MKTPSQSTATSRREFLKASVVLAGAFAMGPLAQAQSAASPQAGGPPRSIHPYPNQAAWGAGTLALSQRAALASMSQLRLDGLGALERHQPGSRRR